MLEGRALRVEVRPEVVLEVLADLKDHDAVERDGLAAAALNAELGSVDLPDEAGVEGGGGGGGRAPVLGGDAGEAVALDVEERDGGPGGGGGLVGRRRGGDGGVGRERVLGSTGVPELEDAGAVDLRHGRGLRGLGFGGCARFRGFRVWRWKWKEIGRGGGGGGERGMGVGRERFGKGF